MGLFGFKKEKSTFPWTPLESSDTLKSALESTQEKPVLVFKHSTRCSISAMALSRFESQFDPAANCALFYLDLLAHRPISNEIAALTEVEHQSPQAILVYKNEVVYHASHSNINATEILDRIKSISHQ